MASGRGFGDRDRHIAQTFSEAARRAGVRKIVYLGGLGDPAEVRSKHLISGQEVGRILAARGVPVFEFRAAVIVGSGSVSFEVIRYLMQSEMVVRHDRAARQFSVEPGCSSKCCPTATAG